MGNLLDRNIFDFTSMYHNGEKLYVKKIIFHYIGYGDVNIITSDGEYVAELTTDDPGVQTVVDGEGVFRNVDNQVETEVYGPINDDAHTVRVATMSSTLRLLDVQVVVGSKSYSATKFFDAYIPEDNPVPGGGFDDEDPDMEEYTYDFGEL